MIMAMQYATYDEFFRAAFNAPEGPFDYQRRLALEDSLYSLVDVPTGAGKTAAVLGAWLWRRQHTPSTVGRRLVYCLPMRTLVEQTRNVAKCAVNRLNTDLGKERFSVHTLMGGDVSDAWDMNPEGECILIGTQDMLLSRALNRGYAMSRFRWPVHFGLLNNDCLWVFDEIQLMGDGLATSAQLAALREQFGAFGKCQSIWMSATLDRDWLKMVDFKSQVDGLRELTLTEADRSAPVLAKRLTAVKWLQPAPPTCRLPQGLAAFVKANHQAGTQTLVVVNQVARACEIFSALQERYSRDADKPEIKLIHSRFRPEERKAWKQLFDSTPGEVDRIIVATQVVEAGVDMSSRLLITDLAPFSSLVQRFGRCNRTGDDGLAEIHWVDRPLTNKIAKLADKEKLEEEDLGKIALPYGWPELKRAEEKLGSLQSASPSVLTGADYKEPYGPAHVLRRRDLVDLFDTTPDLSGYDLDVSRFVRGGDERDVSVAWRELNGEKPGEPDKKDPALTPNELCPVAIGEFREYLKGKDKRGNNRKAWLWDALEGSWRKINENELRPGLTLLIDANAGGYSKERGWSKESKEPVAPVTPDEVKANDAYDADQLTFHWKKYNQTLKAHSREAKVAVETILAALNDLPLSQWQAEVIDATHHHDWGKAHTIFQETLHKGLSESFSGEALAKSTGHHTHTRKRFRHELASALALLQTGASDLVIYLAACHHGKVRLSIRALPDETRPNEAGRRFARGLWQNEILPATDLGDGAEKLEIKLDLEPMLLGVGEDGKPSWLERMINLRDRLGIFRLAYLECLIRAADVRASANPKDYWSNNASEEGEK
jgi:CRISPR-associated endonuclease/helicase Cas3